VTLFLDLETRSHANLRDVGVYRYVEDPDFAILFAAWAVDDGPVQVTEDWRSIPGLFDPAVVKCAHNAAFERVCLTRAVPGIDWLDPEEWRDTLALAALAGYPLGLDDLASALGVGGKDSAGKNLIRLFSTPRRDGTWNDATTHPEQWQAYQAYCAQDVEVLRAVNAKLGDWPADEHAVWCADQRINDRGVAIDRAMARAARSAAELNGAAQRADVTLLSGVANPASQPQMMAWLDGVVPNLQAVTVTEALAGESLDPVQREVLSLRQDLALSASAKYTAALATVSRDGRIRGSFRYGGAHTGRWAGRGVQLHNLPRAAFDSETEAAAVRCDLAAGLGASALDLKRSIRSLFVGPFTVADYSAIEARVLAWLAGEAWSLEAFRAGRDIYAETALRMGGLSRQQGKVATLALGYAGGVGALRVMGAEGSDAELERMRDVWRMANPRTVGLWARLGAALEGEGGVVGEHLQVTRAGTTLRVRLPSGRALYYRGLRWDTYTVDGERRTGWRYNDPRRPGMRVGTYAGRLCENVTQAVARDLLAGALVRLDRAGWPVVAHVHDEVVVDGLRDVTELTGLLCAGEPWSQGLPLAAEGFVTERYRKA
jgi:DNA polymerase